MLGAAVSDLSISLNGQQYHTSANTTFRYFAQPSVLSVSPASGPTSGETSVTVSGVAFAWSFNNLCRWGDVTTNVTWLAASQLVCASPKLAVGVVDLEITQNGQQYTSGHVHFSYFLPPSVHYLGVPGTIGELASWQSAKVTLPQAGYVLVRAWGSGFMGGTDYRCQINRHSPIAATYDSTMDCILCWSDLWEDGVNTVEVSLNGREYTQDGANITINKFW